MDNWMMPADIDRLELNAALTRLTDGWEPDAAELVIRALHSLPLFEGKMETSYTLKGGPTTSVTGHTAEQGDINVEVPNEQKSLRLGVNRNVLRLGSFKIHRWSVPEADGLVFSQFWTSDLTTRGEQDPPHWVLEYDAKTLSPLEFSRHEIVPDDFSIWERFVRFWLELAGGSFEKLTCSPTVIYPSEEKEQS